MVFGLVGCGKENVNDNTSNSQSTDTNVSTTVENNNVNENNNVINDTVVEDENNTQSTSSMQNIDTETYGVDNPLANYSYYVDMPTNYDVSGTLEEKYNEHLEKHVFNYDMSKINDIAHAMVLKDCAFCVLDKKWFDDTLLGKYDDSEYTSVFRVYPDYGLNDDMKFKKPPYNDRQWYVKGNTVVYVHTVFENENWRDAYAQPGQENWEENPYWYNFYYNNDYFKDFYVYEMANIYRATGIMPDNVTILLKLSANETPFAIFTTDYNIQKDFYKLDPSETYKTQIFSYYDTFMNDMSYSKSVFSFCGNYLGMTTGEEVQTLYDCVWELAEQNKDDDVQILTKEEVLELHPEHK